MCRVAMPLVYVVEPRVDSLRFVLKPPKRKKSKLYIIDGRRYHVHKIYTTGRIRLRCKKRSCKGRGTLNLDGTFQQFGNEKQHCCERNPWAVEEQQFRDRLINEICVSNGGCWKVFARVLKTCPTGMPVDFNKYKKNMRHEKRKINPRMPKTLEEMGETLGLPQYKRMMEYAYPRSGQMEVKVIKNFNANDSSNSVSVVFADKGFISEVLTRVEDNTLEGFCDATFRPVPRSSGAQQLLVFQVVRFNRGVPLFYALMDRKTEETYTAIFKYVFSELAPQLKNQLKKVHVDFERAEANTFESLLPNAKVVTCLFHFAQAQWKNVKKRGALKNLTRKNHLTEEKKLIFSGIREVIGIINKLPHLPSEMINEELVDIIVKAASEQVQRRLERYIHYFKRQWLVLRPPKIWSVAEEVHRTNNFAESSNRDMNLIFSKNPTPWEFVRTLADYQSVIAKAFQSQKSPRYYNRQKEKVLKDGIELFKENIINRMEYLETFVNVQKSMDNDMFEQFLEDYELENKGEESEDIDSVDMEEEQWEDRNDVENCADGVELQQGAAVERVAINQHGEHVRLVTLTRNMDALMQQSVEMDDDLDEVPPNISCSEIERLTIQPPHKIQIFPQIPISLSSSLDQENEGTCAEATENILKPVNGRGMKRSYAISVSSELSDHVGVENVQYTRRKKLQPNILRRACEKKF